MGPRYCIAFACLGTGPRPHRQRAALRLRAGAVGHGVAGAHRLCGRKPHVSAAQGTARARLAGRGRRAAGHSVRGLAAARLGLALAAAAPRARHRFLRPVRRRRSACLADHPRRKADPPGHRRASSGRRAAAHARAAYLPFRHRRFRAAFGHAAGRPAVQRTALRHRRPLLEVGPQDHLLGRARFGWRGRTARRVLYAGSALLLLAYVGSRFVLEVVLARPPV